ncbi:MAG: hypothetical protein BWK77_08175 [Verrucomicrobia bacterium A1]|nr:MAG: hypothetical protein BWK77_08175 [Verrucomicrobia bacterium A1]
MNGTVKIAVLDNLCQAQMLESALNALNIPHVIRSYEDLVLDGLFQNSKGWGHVEAAAEHRPAILAALEDLRSSGDTSAGPA